MTTNIGPWPHDSYPPVRAHATANITPFTYYDGLTFLEILSELRSWLSKTLIPGLDGIIDIVDGMIQGALENVELDLEVMRQEVNDALASIDVTDAELRAYVDDVLQQVINNSIELQDAVAAGLVSDEDSDTRAALDEQYARKGVFVVNVADLGAPLDGIGDDTPAIQNAIDEWSGALGALKLVAPPGSTLRSSGWTVVGKDVLFDFRNSHVVKTSGEPILRATGEWDTPVGVAGVESSATGSSLSVADASGFKPGDLVKVYSDNLIWDARQRESMGTELARQGEFATVRSVSGLTVNVTPRLVDTYDTGIRVAKMEERHVDFRFGTASFDASTGGGAGRAFLRHMFVFDSVWSPRIDGHVLSQPGGTVRFTSCFAPRADIEVDNAPQADGYGVNDSGSTFGDYHIVMRSGRHAFTDNHAPRTNAGNTDPGSHGRSMFATVRGKSMGLMQAHWDTHHGGYGHKFISVTAVGSPTSGVPGFSLRGQRHELINCTAANMPVGFRFHTEEDEAWATCQRHIMTGCVTRDVSQAILINLLKDRSSATVPTVTIDGGLFETTGSTSIYTKQANVVLNNPVFQIGAWTSGFPAPFILGASWVTGSMRILNAVGDLSASEMVNAANSTRPSRFDCDVYYLSGNTTGDGLRGFIRSNNAVVSLRLRTARPFPIPAIVGTTASAWDATATVTSAEGGGIESTSAMSSRLLTSGATVSIARSADPAVVVSIFAADAVTVAGVARGSFAGQLLILSNTQGGPGTITIPANGDNLAIGSDEAIAAGETLQLLWNSARSNNAWVRVS